ncbi:MAG: hypothetical protein AABW59_02870 [archaeon]
MTPIKKVRATSPEKYRRVARVTSLVKKKANTFYGAELMKAEGISKFVLDKTPVVPGWNTKKGPIGTAHNVLQGRSGHTPAVCFDRCNLAIGLLNAAGIKSWLVREVSLGSNATWELHDYVEAVVGGKVHTIVFGYNPAEGRLYRWIDPRPAHKALSSPTSIFLRGADSANIGGVKDMRGVVKLRNRLENTAKFALEQKKNKRRIALMAKEGLMPKDFARELIGGG